MDHMGLDRNDAGHVWISDYTLDSICSLKLLVVLEGAIKWFLIYVEIVSLSLIFVK